MDSDVMKAARDLREALDAMRVCADGSHGVGYDDVPGGPARAFRAALDLLAGIEAASEQPAAASDAEIEKGNLYRVNFDCSDMFVVAPSFGAAIERFHARLIEEDSDGWSDSPMPEPDTVELVASSGDVVLPGVPPLRRLAAERDAALVSLGQLQAERDADEKAYLEDIENLKIQTRCPDCGCATPEDAEASECGCDSPVCRITAPGTLATEFAGLHAERDALRTELAAIRGRDAKPFDWDGVPTVEEWIAENLREREPRAGSQWTELHPDEVIADRGESRRVAGWLKDIMAERDALRAAKEVL